MNSKLGKINKQDISQAALSAVGASLFAGLYSTDLTTMAYAGVSTFLSSIGRRLATNSEGKVAKSEKKDS